MVRSRRTSTRAPGTCSGPSANPPRRGDCIVVGAPSEWLIERYGDWPKLWRRPCIVVEVRPEGLVVMRLDNREMVALDRETAQRSERV